ncbi:sulfite exporter TauE/SafE family protein [Syntrophomonas palmitatica]|uniref:sulfite exporter TauE/SafE family protein n=1 Tax=Syntrophomonas palmitatica TaxID=402877 RepID=UPI0006D24E05|nr:sulfite exporter TauE/SafE family protein [Syntrophomonas palmitatica]
MKIKTFLKNYIFILILIICLILGLISSLYYHPLVFYGIKSNHELIILMLVGVLAGLFGGLLGLGGGAIMLPVLDFWLGYSSPNAIGTTLFAVIFTVLSGAHGHYIRKNAHNKVSLDISLGGIFGILAGSCIFTLLVDKVQMLNLCMGIFFLLPAYLMTRDGVRRENDNHISGQYDSLAARWGIPEKVWLLGLGFMVGLITGTLGLGGGFLLVPGITYGIGLSVHLAVGSTMLAAVPITMAGSLVKLLQGFVVLPAAFCLAIGTVIGAR